MDKTPFSLSVTPPPHLRAQESINTMALDLFIAMIPPILMALMCYGLRAMLILLLGAVSAWIINILWGAVTRSNHFADLSAPVTGLLFAMLLPANAPLWMCPLGAFIAIVMVRELTGGLSRSIFNPAAAAAIFMLLVFPGIMTDLPTPRSSLQWFGSVPYYHGEVTTGLWAMFIGKYPGYIGTFCPAAILTGGIYLFMRRASSRRVTFAFLFTAAVIALFYFGENGVMHNVMYQLLSGTVIFTAIFIAGDPATTPVTPVGMMLFGAGCGLLDVLIRDLGFYSDGACFAVLIMNTLTGFIDLKIAPEFDRWSDSVRRMERRGRSKARAAK